ncbi:MAG: hypothetical protein EF813_03050 [Methanosarcinales archaeon]|nr:MAG: hypothetical protein EF813_03050 [Methanosarcinales archaeon]
MIELRTCNYSRIDKIIGQIEDADIDSGVRIGLGSEGCVHKLPSLEDLMRAAELDCTGGVTLVTPITPQKHYDRMHAYLGEITDLGIKNLRIVVNDLGILHSCDITSPIAGRGIVHTSEACPWADHILRDESDYVRDAYLQTSLNYSRTSALFKEMGVKAIEIDLLPRTITAAKKLDFTVYAHFGYAVVAYARSCHTARFHQKIPPECAQFCDSPMELELREIFDLESLGFTPPDADVEAVFPTLYLLGNAIYMKSECHDAAGAEGVIVNCDMYEPASKILYEMLTLV